MQVRRRYVFPAMNVNTRAIELENIEVQEKLPDANWSKSNEIHGLKEATPDPGTVSRNGHCTCHVN